MQNPRGNRSIAEYMRDVRSIVDSLALVDNPIPEEDIFLSVITQLGPEFDNIASALRARDSAIGFDDLFDRLQDAESQMKKDVSLSDSMTTPMPGESSSITIPTANYASHNSKPFKSVTSMTPNNQNWRNNNHQRQNWRSHASSQNRLPSTTNNRNFTQLSRNGSFCYYCNRPNHLTKDCRQLQKFLTNFGVQPQANMTTLGHVPPQPWLFDSGASHHVTSDLSNLSTYSDYGGPDVINLGDGSGLSITHKGNSSIHTPTKSLVHDNVLYAPALRQNLVSVAKFCKSNNVSLEFFPDYFLVKDLRTGAPLLRGQNHNDVYVASSLHHPQINVSTVTPLQIWHRRLGHPSPRILKSVVIKNKLCSCPSDLNISCHDCQCNKSHKLPFRTNSSLISTAPLQLVYTDVWGPSQLSVDKFHYYLIFVDHFSEYIWFYPMRHKSDVGTLFPHFKLLVEKYFQLPLISVYSDNGGEYELLKPIFKSCGISHFTTPPHTPELNGTAERRNRHITVQGWQT